MSAWWCSPTTPTAFSASRWAAQAPATLARRRRSCSTSATRASTGWASPAVWVSPLNALRRRTSSMRPSSGRGAARGRASSRQRCKSRGHAPLRGCISPSAIKEKGPPERSGGPRSFTLVKGLRLLALVGRELAAPQAFALQAAQHFLGLGGARRVAYHPAGQAVGAGDFQVVGVGGAFVHGAGLGDRAVGLALGLRDGAVEEGAVGAVEDGDDAVRTVRALQLDNFLRGALRRQDAVLLDLAGEARLGGQARVEVVLLGQGGGGVGEGAAAADEAGLGAIDRTGQFAVGGLFQHVALAVLASDLEPARAGGGGEDVALVLDRAVLARAGGQAVDHGQLGGAVGQFTGQIAVRLVGQAGVQLDVLGGIDRSRGLDDVAGAAGAGDFEEAVGRAGADGAGLLDGAGGARLGDQRGQGLDRVGVGGQLAGQGVGLAVRGRLAGFEAGEELRRGHILLGQQDAANAGRASDLVEALAALLVLADEAGVGDGAGQAARGDQGGRVGHALFTGLGVDAGRGWCGGLFGCHHGGGRQYGDRKGCG